MKPDLQALLVYWQRELNLTHWKIQIQYVKNLCAPREGAATGGGGDPVKGLCYPLADNRSATIQIRDPELSDDGVPYASSEVERTVCHEVYHCKVAETGLSLLGPAGALDEEQLVWDTSDALVRLKGTRAGAMLVRVARCGLMTAAVIQKTLAAASRVVKQAPPPKGAGAWRQRKMDPIMLAAFEAALEAADPVAAIKALLEKIKGVTDAGGDAPSDTPPGPSDDGMGASAAGDCADKPTMARSQRRAMQAPGIKAMSGDEVRKILAEEREKEALISTARASRVGVTPPLAMHLQGLPLAEARKLIDGLELKPTEPQQVRAAAIPVGAAGGEPVEDEDALSDEAKQYLDAAFPGTPRLVAPRAAAALPAGQATATESRPAGRWTVAELRERQQKAVEEQRSKVKAAEANRG